jgi:predicted nucleotidyltransferase component of viral defense system
MVQTLRDIYSDAELANCLGFKGGTALMFFHELPRFSVALDFNLLVPEKNDIVYQKLRKIVLKYGKIHDEAQKFYGSIIVLDYGLTERKLKIEFSNRKTDDAYDICNLLGINIKVMRLADMFANKLCALLDRKSVVNRDIFDCWFFMENRTPVNKNLVENRMNMPFADYLQNCIDALNKLSNKNLLNGIGDLIDDKMKHFVRTKLCNETIMLLQFYKEFPILL